MAIKLKSLITEGKSIKIFQGRNVYNKGSKYWTTDKEWARNFTQSGLDREIAQSKIDASKIYHQEPMPQATSDQEMDAAVEAAKVKGFIAIWVNEGANEPPSIYFI